MAKAKTQKRSKKLAPALLVAGLAGGVVTALRKRGGKASELADRASELADRAKAAAPDQVKDALDKVQGGGDEPAGEETRRYAAPAEAGSQPPAQPDGAPSDATVVRETVADTDDSLLTKPHDLPEDVVMPDTSDDDPAVREAEAAAAADAGAIGGDPDTKA
jgi:hypothetical protein